MLPHPSQDHPYQPRPRSIELTFPRSAKVEKRAMLLCNGRSRGVRRSRCPARACAKAAEPAKPAVKGSKIAEAPRDLHGGPTTCEPAGAIPGRIGSPQAGHSPRCSNCTTRGRPGRRSRACHAALDAMAAGVRTAFGRAATTVAIVTDPRKQGPILTMAKVPTGPAAASMRCTDK
jgi:hypothetical protein